MATNHRQHRALVTREAYSALLNLKHLIEHAAKETKAASMESIGCAIHRRPTADLLRALRIASDDLRSPTFDSAVAEARKKISVAITWHQEVNGE